MPGMKTGVAGVSWQVHGGGFYEMSKYTLAPAELPDHLVWHKWQSYWTWISGFSLLCWVYYGQSSFFLIDPAVMPLSPWQAAAIGVASLALGWIVYDLLCKSPLAKNDALLALVGFGYVVATSYVFTLVFSGRGALIHTGALMATMMTANVFFVIMPNQRKSVAALIAGRDARSEMGEDLQAALDPQQLHHAARPVHDAVEPLSRDLRQSRAHSGDRHLRHHRRRARPLFLQRWHAEHRQGAVVGVAGRRRWRSGRRSGSRWRRRRACGPTLGLGRRPADRWRRRSIGRARRRRWSRSCRRAASMCHAPEPVWEGIGEAPKGVLLDTPEHIAALRAGDPHAGGADPCDAAQQPHGDDRCGARVLAHWLAGADSPAIEGRASDDATTRKPRRGG